MMHRTRAERRNSTAQGFTLVEVLIAVMIMGMMLMSITKMLTAVRTTRDTVHNIQESMLAGPAILDQIERDLAAILVLDRPVALHLQVTNRIDLGLDADRIDFVSTSNSMDWRSEGDRFLRADYNEVGFCARPNEDEDQFLELYRREGFGVDDEPFTGGTYQFLHDRVRAFDIEVLPVDGDEEEPLEEWGKNPEVEDEIGLPAAVRISVTIELAPRLLREQLVFLDNDKRTVTYTRTVRFSEMLRGEEGTIPYLTIPASPADASAPVDDTLSGDQLQDRSSDLSTETLQGVRPK
jgi:prepilin-type N-terminal cleavage/methylation domain-containing protein